MAGITAVITDVTGNVIYSDRLRTRVLARQKLSEDSIIQWRTLLLAPGASVTMVYSDNRTVVVANRARWVFPNGDGMTVSGSVPGAYQQAVATAGGGHIPSDEVLERYLRDLSRTLAWQQHEGDHFGELATRTEIARLAAEFQRNDLALEHLNAVERLSQDVRGKLR